MQHMQKSQAIVVIRLSLATLLMLVSLTSESIDLASQNYRASLATSLGTMIVADILCVPSVFSRSRERWIAVLIAMPSLFILWDFARRAPYVFSK
jgi:hypothetical protein